VVAKDPWTGKQVRIDPIAKTVASPADFPLDFRVNGFRVVGPPPAAVTAAQ
jgi:hypothetical protein